MHVLHTFSNNSHVPYLTWFAERAAKEGSIRYSFIILYPERPKMMEEMAKLGFPCIWIPYDDKARKRGMLLALPRLWWHIRKAKPDIVHCNLFDDTLPGLIAARCAGIRRRVITRQDTGFHWRFTPKWTWLDRWNTWLATHVIAISGECRKFLMEKEKAPRSKLWLVHNGIPPERFTNKDPEVMSRLSGQFGTAEHYPIIGTIARFIAWKGYRHIVDAAKIIVQDHPNALFLFCGQGDQEADVRKWVMEAGLEKNVVFTGWVNRSEIASFIGLFDIYLHAAELEPFGLVYPEAMMNGVPVVSTRTGAALDAINDGLNGILVEHANGTCLANGVHRLLSADVKAIGLAGKETAMNMFPFEVMWEGTMNVYREALAGTK